MSRLDNSVRNLKVGTVGILFSYLCNFVTRKLFVMYLSAEYLGLNGLFSNILMVLSLSELGVGSAICFSLYKPLAFGKTETIQALMQLYRKAYTIIGCIVLGVGLSLTPLLPYLLNDVPDIPHLNAIYALFVINSGCSYFLSYKRTIFIADQKKYVDSLYHYGFSLIKNLLQILVLVLTGNFIAYLFVVLFVTLSENLLINRRANRAYPYLLDKGKKHLAKGEVQAIKKNVFALMFHQIGYVMVNGTDNILIVKLVDLVSAGLYANYTMIFTAINKMLSVFYNSFTASIGNLSAETKGSGNKRVFDQLHLITAWIIGFCSICLLFLYNPFISLWLGNAYLFDFHIVLIIVVNFYLAGMLRPLRTFHNSLGLFWFDRYKPLAESAVNIVVSILLGRRYGVIGILLGTAISNLTVCSWIEPYVIYKYGFHKPVGGYFVKSIFYTFVTCLAGFLTFFCIRQITIANGVVRFLVTLCTCLIIPNLVFFLSYCRTKEFSGLLEIVKKMISKGAH